MNRELKPDSDIVALTGAARGGKWQSLPLEGTKRPTKWLPVVMPKSLGSPIGIAAEGYWAAPTLDGLRLLSTEDRGVLLLVALEYDLDELRAILRATDSELGVDSVLVSRFPFGLVVRAAIDTGSEEWVTRALTWLEQDGQLANHETKTMLRAVADNRTYDQKLRQRADRLSRALH